MAESSLPSIGDWVDNLLNEIFFQPIDKVATTAYDTGISRDVKVRVNAKSQTFDSYKQLIFRSRDKYNMTSQSNDELLCAKADEKGKAGSVAHLGRFTLKDKKTGQAVKSASVTLVTVEWIDGARRMTELTEVLE